MLKDVDDKPKVPARERATRRWRNHDLEKRFKEERAKPSPDPHPGTKELEVGDIIKNEELKKGTITKNQTKFAKYIREMLDDHKHKNDQRNLQLYKISIRAQRYRLLKEKLRRLEAREAERQAQRKKRDLFV